MLERVLGETNQQGLWGDRVATVIGLNATPTSVNCEVNPVPNLRDQFRNRDVSMLVAWCIAGPCALFALFLCFRQLHAYSRCERSARRTYYTGVVLMAPVFAITNFLPLFFPRAASMFELLQHVYEAQALYSFGMLIFDLASGGETDYLVAREVFLARLALGKPKKLDASPPLCFLMPCVPEVLCDGPRLDRIMTGLSVFGIVVPACAVVRLWVLMECKNAYILYASSTGLFLIENLAMSYTLYNLFQLYVLTHDLLHHYNTTPKFLAIKAILGIAVLQGMVIKVVVKKFIQPGAFTIEAKAEFWASFALTVEAIVLARAHGDAYPVSELQDVGMLARTTAAHTRALELLAVPEGPHAHPLKDTEAAAADVHVLELDGPDGGGAPQASQPWSGETDDSAWPAPVNAPAGAPPAAVRAFGRKGALAERL